MQGLWLENQHLQLRTDLPQPQPAADEALVRVLSAGICNTDLELLRGYYPYTGVIGHEFVGVVEAGPPSLMNQRVVGEINASCGQCQYCLQHLTNHCENRTVLGIVNRHGAFAEYLTLPVKNLYPLPAHIPTAVATFTEPIAAALEIQEQVRLEPRGGQPARILVVGDGKLGQLIAQTLALTGQELIVVGRHPAKLDLLQARGITTQSAEQLQQRSFDVAVDCTGNPAGFEMARQALRPRGTLVMKSTYAGHLTVDASALVVDEITVVGSRCGPFAKAIDVLAAGQVDVEPLIQARYPLSEGLAAFKHAQRRGTLKVLLDMSA